VSGWPRALAWIRRIEGGYVNHPADPGGATFAGVSLRAVVRLDRDKDGKLDFDLDGDGDVDADDIRLLHAHPEKVSDFYHSEYFEPVGASTCPWPLAIRAFDAAVHHGVGGATLLVQKACRIKVDGINGPGTSAAMRVAGLDEAALARFDLERLDLLHRISARRNDPFFRGWANRVLLLQREANAG
jgi:lysozyme family protein